MRTLLLALLLTPALASAAVYKWRDEAGRLHYSDQPVDGAEAVELPPPSTYKAPDTPPARERPRLSIDEAAPEYRQVVITEPDPDATYRNATGTVPVRVVLDPPLRGGHRVLFLLDGQPWGEPQRTTTVQLQELPRGAHVLQAVVIDNRGERLARSEPVPFFLHKPSQLLRPGGQAGDTGNTPGPYPGRTPGGPAPLGGARPGPSPR